MPITLVAGNNIRDVALTPIPPVTIIDLVVIASADDAYQAADGVLTLDRGLLVRSYPLANYIRVSTGLRFQNVIIPRGAVVITAYVSIYPPSDTLDRNANMRLYLENTDNAIDFVTSPTILTRSRTSASTPWVQDGLPGGTYVNSPSFSASLQEVVSRPGWVSGNSLTVLMIANEDIEKAIRAYGQESYLNLPARLHVEYYV